mmetsp:Transcript_113953/g.302838  ORF Transcript_113953/g.302838 Transcript_113953/m.302838 type:complete len:216 (+) Transcript_113953:1164-1811(+)
MQAGAVDAREKGPRNSSKPGSSKSLAPPFSVAVSQALSTSWNCRSEVACVSPNRGDGAGEARCEWTVRNEDARRPAGAKCRLHETLGRSCNCNLWRLVQERSLAEVSSRSNSSAALAKLPCSLGGPVAVLDPSETSECMVVSLMGLTGGRALASGPASSHGGRLSLEVPGRVGQARKRLLLLLASAGKPAATSCAWRRRAAAENGRVPLSDSRDA